jgi:hypothetical protein
MTRFNSPIAFVAMLSAGLLFGAADSASAQKTKKVSYEEAWALCRADVQANTPPETTQSAARYTRGAACMKKYGYRLKKQ